MTHIQLEPDENNECPNLNEFLAEVRAVRAPASVTIRGGVYVFRSQDEVEQFALGFALAWDFVDDVWRSNT